MSLFSLKNLRKSAIYIIPNFPSLETKRYKFRLFQLVNYFILFVIILSIILSLLFTFTPLNRVIMFMEENKISEQKEQVTELEDRVIILVNELNRISKLNKRLGYVLTLAKTDSLDSTAAIYDSLRSTKGNLIPLGGSVLKIFEKIVDEYFIDTTFFINPINALVGREFNPEKGHLGIDYFVKVGTPVFAPADGVIIFSDYTAENGNVIIIQHTNNYLSIFKHCSASMKETRDEVTQGELIALSGNTGKNTTGAHLHFEIWKNNKPINPKTKLIN